MPKWKLSVAAILLVTFQFHSAATGTEPESQIEQIREINQQIAQTWDEYELKPSPHASDGEWCRRVYLDIIGRIPTYKGA